MPTRLILILILFSLVISIAYYLFPDVRHNVLPVLAGLDLRWLALALVLTLAHYLAEAGRWWFYLLNGASRSRLLRRLVTVFSLTAFVTYMLPLKLGVPLRVYLLCSQIHLSFQRASALLLIDGMLAYGIWAASTLALYLALPAVPGFDGTQIYVISVIVLVALVFLLLVRKSGAMRSWRAHFQSMTPRMLAAGSAILVLDIVGYVLRHAAILWSLGADLPAGQVALATVASITVGFLSMLPMGIGAYDVTLIFLLSVFSVSPEIAFMVPLVNRAGNVLVSILLGLPASWATGVSLLALRARHSHGRPNEVDSQEKSVKRLGEG